MEEQLADPGEARSYLELAIQEYQQDHDLAAFLIALRHIVNAQGGIGRLAKRTGLRRRHLYRVLSNEGNPRFETIIKIVNALNLRIEKLGVHPEGALP